MERLTYDVLNTLFGDDIGTGGQLPFLEVTNVDVRRLRDDRSEIQIGQDVAFVATASFRVLSTAVGPLKDRIGAVHIATGDELLVIGPDAELRSDKLEIDEDSVALWLKDHYDFAFLLNGSPNPAFRNIGSVRVSTPTPPDDRREMSLPWITRLNTAAVKDDYIDVDVQITTRDDGSTTTDKQARMRFISDLREDAAKPLGLLGARIELLVDPDLIEQLGQHGGQRYVVDLPAPRGVQLAVHFEHCKPHSSNDSGKGDGKGDGKPPAPRSKP